MNTPPKTYFTVEHVRYSHGGKDEEETAFTDQQEAREFALDQLQRYGGRVWVNNVEYTLKQLARKKCDKTRELPLGGNANDN